MEKARESQKNIYFCFINYAKAFDCVDHNKLWKILKEMGILDHLTGLLRNLHADLSAARMCVLAGGSLGTGILNDKVLKYILSFLSGAGLQRGIPVAGISPL